MILQPPLTNSTNIRLPYPLIVRSAGLHHPHVVRNPEHPQRQAVDGCPPGAILVMDSRKDPRAASAGDILVTRLQMRGVGGVVTDGGFRDAMKIAELEIPAYHNRPSSPTNLTRHQRSEEHTSELLSLMRISYAVYCLQKNNKPDD